MSKQRTASEWAAIIDIKYDMARLKSQLLVKVINKLSFELGHPKDDLVFIVKEMIKKGKL